MTEKLKETVTTVSIILLLIGGLALFIYLDNLSEPDPTEGINILRRANAFFKKNQVEVVVNEEVEFEEEYDFILAKSPTTYLPVSPDNIEDLREVIYLGAKLEMPDGIDLVNQRIQLLPKKVEWQMWNGDSTTYVSAHGLALKVQATIYINETAKEKGKITLDLPNLEEIENSLDVTITFPKNDIRNGSEITLQSVSVRKSHLSKMFFSTWKYVLAFIICAILLTIAFLTASKE